MEQGRVERGDLHEHPDDDLGDAGFQGLGPHLRGVPVIEGGEEGAEGWQDHQAQDPGLDGQVAHDVPDVVVFRRKCLPELYFW